MKKGLGTVYLVGGGPGDPGLLTLRGAALLRRADVIVMDALVDPRLSALKKRGARVIFVGKRGPGAPLGARLRIPQSGINRLLVRLARRHKAIVRLKGGDPFVFGRGGEEIETLRSAGVPYEIVPGVTSALAAPAYAGIPVTDRRWASQVSWITGQTGRDDNAMGAGIEWKRLPREGTLLVLMGVAAWPRIRRRLIDEGWSPSLPIAAIESGTTGAQRVVTATLQSSDLIFRQNNLAAPAVIVVGRVSSMASRLAWFGSKPLVGRRVAITRPSDQVDGLAGRLAAAGATLIHAPLIKTERLSLSSAMRRRLAMTRWAALIFASRNGVRHFSALAGEIRGLKRTPVFAVGPQTASEARQLGWRVSGVAAEYSAAGLGRFLRGRFRNADVLLPRVAGGPTDLADALRRTGARVAEVPIYRTRRLRPSAMVTAALLNDSDAITFTSASTVEAFSALVPSARRREVFGRINAVSIGAATSAALTKAGFRRIHQANEATMAALSIAVEKSFSEGKKR